MRCVVKIHLHFAKNAGKFGISHISATVMIYRHKVRHDHAERVSQVHRSV